MKDLEDDFFLNIADAVLKAGDISNFQEEVPRQDKEKAKVDYIADGTEKGFVVDAKKSEEVQKDIEEFEQQKIDDILDEFDKLVEEA